MFKREPKQTGFQRKREVSEFDQFLPERPDVDHLIVETVDQEEWLEWQRLTK